MALEVTEKDMQFRRKGHRLGLFIVLLSFALVIAVFMDGTPDKSRLGILAGPGACGAVFGYPLARLWYWFRSV